VDNNIKRILKIAVLILFVLVVIVSGITSFYIAYHITDADAASELVLGKLLAEQNRIITTDWYYSSEIRLFNTNLVYMPLSKWIDDWHMVRFLSTLIFQAMLVGSYYYLCRRMKIGTTAFFLSASLMLLPLSDVYGRLVLYQCYYTPCFIFGFLIVGLYLSLLEHHKDFVIKQIIRLMVMLALTAMSCMNGFRQLPCTLMPLFLATIWMRIRNRNILEYSMELRRRSTKIAGLILVAGIAGLYIYTLILPQYCSSEAVIPSVITMISGTDIRRLILDYLSLFGYQQGFALFSIVGLLSLSGAAGAVIMVFLSFSVMFSKAKLSENRLALVLYPISMTMMTLLFLAISGYENYARYYLQTFIWIIPFLGTMLDWNSELPFRITGKQILAVFVTILFITNGVHYHLYYHDTEHRIPDASSGLNTDIYNTDYLNLAVEFLEENEYEVGYATHWQANIVTEMTNGRIPMITIQRVYPEYFYLYRDWLTNKQYRELSFVEDKAIFILLTRAEANIFSGSELAAYGILAYEDEHFVIFTFDFSTEVWDYLLEQAIRYNQQNVLNQLLPSSELS
jgi:hypothetical protein